MVPRELEPAGQRLPTQTHKGLQTIPAAIDRTDNAADVNVGVRILRHFRITTDFAENAVWLEPR